MKPSFNLDETDPAYYYHRKGDNAPVTRSPNFTIKTALQQAMLFRVIHGNINLFCGAHGKVRAAAVAEIYQRYQGWKNDLPPRLQLTQEEPVLLHVLTLQ